MEEPMRVLHIVGAMYPGGIENFIMNVYKHIDRSKVQFDFAVHAEKENDYREQIRALGGQIYKLPRLTQHPVQSLRVLGDLVKEKQYPIVIRHTPNALVAPQLWVAKKAGAVTVCQAHSETDAQKVLHMLGKGMLVRSTDKCLACSPKAGAWMFGNHPFEIVHNAIDIDQFAYETNKADRIRHEFNLAGKHVYGHIGNFSYVKNHSFLLEVFQKIAQKDPDAVLFCLGEGDLRPEIEKKIAELGLKDKVFLTGIRYDVADFMSAIQVLIFPSLFEGLPLTLVEAQAAGLKIVMSDVITRDVIVTKGLVTPMPLAAGPEVWADKCIELAGSAHDRTCQKQEIAAHGYDIEVLGSWYQDFLLRTAGRV